MLNDVCIPYVVCQIAAAFKVRPPLRVTETRSFLDI